MKKYTHAWVAFMAIKRLEEADLGSNRKYADDLIRWFRNHRDDMVQGAWYPDEIIYDMGTSHVLKHTPADGPPGDFGNLPSTYMCINIVKDSPLRQKSFTLEKGDNLPYRCEAIAHSVIDSLKMQESEDKGSPVVPTDNHVALLLFMLSHYVADAHVPPHCDSRSFSSGKDIHGHIEGEWEDLIRALYPVEEEDERFIYDTDGYPYLDPTRAQDYEASFLKTVADKLLKRKFQIGYGKDNDNVLEFMTDLCRHSYLMSFKFIPEGYDHTNVTVENLLTLQNELSFDDMSVAVFTDAIDSIARIWLRVWRRYIKWVEE